MGLFKNTGEFISYVSTLTGSDSSIGDRINPYQSITKALSISPYMLLNGKSIENISIGSGVNITGDNELAELAGINILSAHNDGFAYLKNLKANDISCNGCSIVKCNITSLHIYDGYQSLLAFYGNFIINLDATQLGESSGTFANNTICNFVNKNNSFSGVHKYMLNTIIVNSIDLYNFTSRDYLSRIPIFKYCLFRKATIWNWNNVAVPINYGTYGNEIGDYMADVISAWYEFAQTITDATDKAYCMAMFPTPHTSTVFYVTPGIGQTCKVVDDSIYPIFNRYVDGEPVDYTLRLDGNNVALTMSDQNSYVGCHHASTDVITFGDVVNVNEDGSDDLVTPSELLINTGNGKFHANQYTTQTRNRVRSTVASCPRGFSFLGMQSSLKSGLDSLLYFGKKQPFNVTDAPTIPQESVEIIPYDLIDTPSEFPRFSAMFNGTCQMWYYTEGAKNNLPVLFNDLFPSFEIPTDKSLAEYGTYAVTNADYETFLLSSKTGVALRNIPIRFFKRELNLNYSI